MKSSEERLGELRANYPGWRVRRVRDYYAATRLSLRSLTGDELSAGLAMTLIEDDVEDLAEQLAKQAELMATPQPTR